MDKITQSLALDLVEIQHNVVNARQGDRLVRALDITITENGRTYEIKNNATVRIRGHRPDGKYIFYDVKIIDYKNGIIHVDIPAFLLSSSGRAKLDIGIYQNTNDGDTEIASTESFILYIPDNIFSEEEVVNSDNGSVLSKLINIAEEEIKEIQSHNSSSTAHSDIRGLISELTTRLNALADSDDTTLDQLSEIVAYIKANRSLIDSITTSKINVADIIDNLTSTATNKPLSAKQGKVLKDLMYALVDALEGGIIDVRDILENKVDKVTGKGLSTNDYTTADKNKLAGIANDAKANVQSDWNVTDSTSDAFIKNKPTPLSVNGGTVTGTTIFSKTTDLSGTADNMPALIVGGTPETYHIEMDNNEIQAKTNGTTPGTLELNYDGGKVNLGKDGKVNVNDGVVTAESFNGSADKLDGLHAKSFIGNNTGFVRPNHVGGSTNANDYTSEWHGFVYNMSNLPPGESYGFLDVTWFNGNGFTPAPPENGGVIRQIFTSWSSGRIYVRMRVNNTWKNWRSNSAETIIDTENRNINIIAAYGDGAGYGTQLVIGGGGNVFLGSGESPGSLYNALQTASNLKTNESYVKSGENLYITSDNDLWLYVNANTVGNRKGLRFGTSGNIVPVNNSEISLGNSENKFNNAWVNEIHIGTPKTVNTPDGNVEFTSRVNITDSGIGFTMAAYGQPYVTLLNDSSLQVTNIKTYTLDTYNITSSLIPNSNNKNLIGTSTTRWKEIWCSTSLNTTSDRNLKKNITDLANDDRYIKFFMMLQPKSYLFKDGESGRTHVGFISQDVEAAMEACGLSSLEFAGFCKDIKTETKQGENEWDREEVPVLDEDGNPVYVYSLRYEEFIALNTMAIQKLYEKSESFEQRLSALEEKM